MLIYESIMYCILNTVWSFDLLFCFALLTLPFLAEELRGTKIHKNYQM